MRIAIPVVGGIVAIVALILAIVAIADDSDGASDVQPQLTELQSQLQDLIESLEHVDDSAAAAQLIAALDALDGTGIHHFDEQTIQAGSLDDVPAGDYRADVRKIRRVVSSIDWPEDLRDEAQDLSELAHQLEDALAGDDLAQMKQLSPQFHSAWHDLREVGYNALSGEAASEEEQHGEHTDGDTDSENGG